MTFEFDRKVAIVTGAGSGIGREISLRFASAGAAVLASDINLETAQETVRLIEAAGGKAISQRVDVTSESDVKAMVELAVKNFGGLDIAINNAGIVPDFVPLHEVTLAAWDRNIAINLTGVFLCMKHEIIYMREHGGGSIVNLSSVAAKKSTPNIVEYAAAKRGVLALTSCAAIEGGPEGIRVNAIMPGATWTPMLERSNPNVRESYEPATPLRRLGSVKNIADAALWLSSDYADYVTGQSIAVDGGIVA